MELTPTSTGRSSARRRPARLARAADLEPRERVALVEAQDDEVLVVAQPDVEARLVLLDELVLEEDRLLLGARDDDLEVAEQIVEQRHEGAVVPAPGVEVASGRASGGSTPCRRRPPRRGGPS